MKLILAVVEVHSPSMNRPDFGMAPGVGGCGERVGYQVIGFNGNMIANYYSWIYPTKDEAIKHMQETRKRHTKFRKKHKGK